MSLNLAFGKGKLEWRNVYLKCKMSFQINVQLFQGHFYCQKLSKIFKKKSKKAKKANIPFLNRFAPTNDKCWPNDIYRMVPIAIIFFYYLTKPLF